MKFGLHSFTVALLALVGTSLQAAGPQVDPDVSSYGVGKVKIYHQSGAGVLDAGATPYHFQGFVNFETGSNVTGAQVEVPGNPTPFLLGVDPNYINGLSYLSPGYASPAALNAAFPESGGYKVKFTTPLLAYDIGSLGFGGAAFPTSKPELVNINSWLNGSFLVKIDDPNAKLEFSAYSDMATIDYIMLDLVSSTGGSSLHLQSQSAITDFSLAPDGNGALQLTMGATYEGALTFLKVNSRDPREGGYSFEAIRTTFSFTAIPEPSTYALMALGLGGIGWLRLRRARR